MLFFRENTCVKFVPRKPSDRPSSFLLIKRFTRHDKEERRCRANVGYGHKGPALHIQEYCYENVPILIHEMMHTLGFQHEQVRPDRDEYLKFHKSYTPEKIKQGAVTDVPYDYGVNFNLNIIIKIC